jgi:glycosyltransferase involved in cell wall biosynthesis
VDRCTAVHGFEHSSLEMFESARRRNKRTVLHFSSEHPRFHDRILDLEYSRFPDLQDATASRLRERRGVRDARRIAEFGAADLIVACSGFAARSLLEEGISADRVVSVPLGAPSVSADDPRDVVIPTDRPIVFLFAGSVGVRKGCHHLLEAWSRARHLPGTLILAGRYELPAGFAKRPGVQVLGSLGQEQLFSLMRSSDLLVFPTLCDSFGMVVTEALAHGLPVLTTTNAGAADLIVHGVNGWVVPAGDVSALEERLRWCADHPEQVRSMRAAARASAARRTWADFRAELRATLHDRGF